MLLPLLILALLAAASAGAAPEPAARPPAEPARSGASAPSDAAEPASPSPSLVAPALPRVSLLPDSLSGAADLWHITGAHLSGSREGSLVIDSLVARHGALHIRALRGVWHPDTRRVELDGEVRIQDGERTLQSEHGFYLRDQALLDLDDDVQGRGPEGRFLADRLRYDRAADRLRLTGRVRLFEDRRTLRCEWLDYELADSFATAGDEILLRDEVDSLEVRGTRLDHDRRAGRMTVTGTRAARPRLVRGLGGSAGALTVVADTLRFMTAAREGEALGWVAIDYGEARGSCDRAEFRLREDRVLLSGLPLVEDREGSVSGDSMAIELRGGVADRLRVWGNARSEYQPQGQPGEVHFALGDTLTADLVDGRFATAVLSGRTQALYLPGRADRDEGIGLNWTRGQRLRLGFGESGVGNVQFEGEVEGRYLLPREREAQAAPGVDSLGAPEAQAAPGVDSLGAPEAPPAPGADSLLASTAGGYSPAIFAAVRELAARGTLDPPDSLLARLPFDPAETVAYTGRTIDFAVATNRIVIAGDARVRYKGMELRSEEIAFRSPDRLVVASGSPELRDGDSQVAGERMSYRIDSRMGLIYQGRSAFEPGYYRGERIKRVSARTFYVEQGEFTSCDAEEPHYHFRAARMKIMPDDKVVARPVVLYIGHVPVLAIPFAVFPQRRGRHSGILMPDVEFGFDSERGRFLRNVGYYWAASDYADALVWMDHYEKDPRLTWNARTRYRKRYALDGQVEGSFTRQDISGGKRDRWLLRIGHDQTLRERWQLKVSGHFQSDKDYADDRDFGADVDERVDRQLRSQLSLSRSWSGAALSLLADRTEYLDDCAGGRSRISQSAPSLSFSLNSFPLGTRADARGHGGRRPWLATMYLRSDLRFLGTYARACEGEAQTNRAAGLGISLSDKRRLLGAVNLTPSASISAAWVARGDGERNLVGATWRAGFSAGTTLYGTFFPRLGPWEGLRHVVELSASYGYRPELEYLKGFPSVGGISLGSSKSSTVSLSATQRFHAKWRRGEESVKQENLLTWGTSSSYDFLARERAREAGTEAQPWGNISHSLRLQPGRLLESDLSIGHDPEFWRRQYNLSLRTTLRLRGGGAGPSAAAPRAGAHQSGAGDFSGHGGFGDPGGGSLSGVGRETESAAAGPWQMTISHVYSRSRQDEARSERHSANLALGLGLTRSWRVQYGLYYDLEERSVTSQGLTLVRDLHCWEATLERRESGGRSTFYFRISVKELPDIKYERRGL